MQLTASAWRPSLAVMRLTPQRAIGNISTIRAGRRASAFLSTIVRATGVMTEPLSSATPSPSERVAGVDAYRGAVMFLMLAEAVHLGKGGACAA